jgi:hypothetical protein
MANTLQMGNDATLTLTGLTNAVTAAAVTDATVTCQPYYTAANGTETAAGSPVTLAHVAAGLYRGTLESSVIGTYYAANAPYRLKYVAVGGTADGEWNLRGYVQERGGS